MIFNRGRRGRKAQAENLEASLIVDVPGVLGILIVNEGGGVVLLISFSEEETFEHAFLDAVVETIVEENHATMVCCSFQAVDPICLKENLLIVAIIIKTVVDAKVLSKKVIAIKPDLLNAAVLVG